MPDLLHLQSDSLMESIECDGRLIAMIIRAERMPVKTEFLTGDEVKQQVGFIVYSKGEQIARHLHLPMERRIVGTSEVLLVRKGKAEVDFYTEDEEYVCSRILRTGDLLLLVCGGHGFFCLEDTVLLEIKQGPYLGLQEKKRF